MTRTIDKSFESDTKIENQTLICGSKIRATKIGNNYVISANLGADFGTCGWSHQSDNNPIPFLLSDPLKEVSNNLRISSYPKQGWIYSGTPSGNTITFSEKAVGSQLNARVHVHLYPNAYADHQTPIRYTSNTITLKTAPPYAMIKDKLKYRLKNVSTLSAGEYYYDYAKKQIVINSDGLTTPDIYVNEKGCIVKLNGVSNVEFENVTFMGGVDGIVINSCKNIKFSNCKFYNIPRNAIFITKSSNITISNCKFANIGFGAVRLQNCGVYDTLKSANVIISGCIFKNCNMTRYTNAAVITAAAGVGLDISNCAFYGSTAAAINLSSNDVRIRQCYFENCCSQTADFGIIYEGRTLTRRGLDIHDCYFKGLVKTANYPSYVVYCDDGYSGSHVHDCIFEDVQGTNACFFSFGRDHLIENCTFINVSCALKIPTPRLPTNPCIPEYKALMSNAAQKSLFIKAYPALNIPIDFSRGYLLPLTTIQNCNICFNNPVGKALSTYITISTAKPGGQLIQRNNRITSVSRRLPDRAPLIIPIANIRF